MVGNCCPQWATENKCANGPYTTHGPAGWDLGNSNGTRVPTEYTQATKLTLQTPMVRPSRAQHLLKQIFLTCFAPCSASIQPCHQCLLIIRLISLVKPRKSVCIVLGSHDDSP